MLILNIHTRQRHKMTSAHYLPSYEGRRAKKTNLSMGHPGLTHPVQPLCLTPPPIWGFIYFNQYLYPPNTLTLLSGYITLLILLPMQGLTGFLQMQQQGGLNDMLV